MATFICKQPNGLYCRHSTIVDCVTHYNMTEEEYIEMCVEEARTEARCALDSKVRPFRWVKEYFKPDNISGNEFKAILKEMESEISETAKMKRT